jgi:hypothetical protein
MSTPTKENPVGIGRLTETPTQSAAPTAARTRVTINDAIQASNNGRHQEAIALAMICQSQEFYWIGKHMRTISEDLNKCLCELTRITEALEEARFGGNVILDVTKR